MDVLKQIKSASLSKDLSYLAGSYDSEPCKNSSRWQFTSKE